MYLERLNEKQIAELENGLSKTLYNGAKVEIKNVKAFENAELYVDGKYVNSFTDDCVTDYDENLCFAYCSYMAHIFKDEYIKNSKMFFSYDICRCSQFLYERIKEGSTDINGLMNRIKYHSNVLSALNKKYETILSPNKTSKETEEL